MWLTLTAHMLCHMAMQCNSCQDSRFWACLELVLSLSMRTANSVVLIHKWHFLKPQYSGRHLQSWLLTTSAEPQRFLLTACTAEFDVHSDSPCSEMCSRMQWQALSCRDTCSACYVLTHILLPLVCGTRNLDDTACWCVSCNLSCRWDRIKTSSTLNTTIARQATGIWSAN